MIEPAGIPESLFDKKNHSIFNGILRGVERESLRTTMEGKLSQTPHPPGLGSALTHPQITTDFSEALLEFITPPTHRIDDLFLHLHTIHSFAASELHEELLWALSMPCLLGNDDDIPVAQYGNSNNGLMKSIYRIGLGHRYGRSMQTVAGVHYNFSLPNTFWAFLSREQNRIEDLQQIKNEGYFGLIRNFRRHYWLLIYLFGASPALCKSFIQGKPHNLDEMEDGHTLYLPHATSLRMGDLGYQSKTQESLYVCYNKTSSYIKSLCQAITQAHAPYRAIGLKDRDGKHLQLNTSILQIENEFYSAIRPKRTAQPGETALAALNNRGVEYIEVRCLDINPLTPLGIDEEQAHFLDTFLLFCALQNSPNTSPDESSKILSNQKQVVNFGRKEDLKLKHYKEGEISAREWGGQIMKALEPIAELLDLADSGDKYRKSLESQKQKLVDSNLTPSAQILSHIKQQNIPFGKYALELSKTHTQTLREHPLSEKVVERMKHMSDESYAEKKVLEQNSTQPFDQYIQDYYRQYVYCSQN